MIISRLSCGGLAVTLLDMDHLREGERESETGQRCADKFVSFQWKYGHNLSK